MGGDTDPEVVVEEEGDVAVVGASREIDASDHDKRQF